MNLKPEQLQSALKKGMTPTYLFGGSEPLLIQECRDAVFEEARQSGFLEREIVHADARYDWEGLRDAAGGPSLFASRKILDLRLTTGKPGLKGAKALTAWAEDPDPDILLVISCEQWDRGSRNSKWAAALGKCGTRVDIWPVSPDQMPAWINSRLTARGLKAGRNATLLLAQRLEGNLLAAQQEIEKLVLLKGQGTVTEQDVLEAVADSARYDSFLLVERIFDGNLAGSLRVTTGLQRTGIPLQMVIGALYRELQTLEAFRLAVSRGEPENTVFRKLNIWSSRQSLVRKAAGRISADRLLSAFSGLSLIDRQGKGRAEGNPWHQLDQLVCALCA